MDDRRPSQIIALSFDDIQYRVRARVRSVFDLIERRFAYLAGVPYQNSASRREWEELWETEATS